MKAYSLKIVPKALYATAVHKIIKMAIWCNYFCQCITEKKLL